MRSWHAAKPRSCQWLLFADLSSYPADAITDLATNYMGSLLKDFPTQQTLWRPPVPQRVALSMIWFGHEAGSLFESAIPPAEARPAGTPR